MGDAGGGTMDQGGITIADMTRILDLIDVCYGSAADADGWMSVLDRLGEMFDAPMRLILLAEPNSRQIKRTLSSTIDRDAQQLWLETMASASGEWSSSNFPAPPQRKTDRIAPLIALECHKAARRSYDALAQRGIQCSLGTIVAVDSTCLGMVGVMRSPSQPPFDATDLARMRIVASHLNRALVLFAQAETEKRQRHAAFAALDRVAPALALLEGNGTVVYHNERMRSLARDGEISIQNGRVHAASSHNRSRILAAVEECYRAALGGDSQPSRTLAVSRASERSPLAIVVSAVRIDLGGDAPGTPLVVLLASDPDVHYEIQRGALSEMYGMTGAEADVAGMLAEGLSPDEISHDLGISMNTVRTHMKRAFEKTRVGRQADLVRVLLSNPVHTLSRAEPGDSVTRPACRTIVP